jgi:hypothetical protein
MNVAPFAGLPPWMFLVLFATGLLAGFVDSIAGGGGLITLPVLLSVGLPPSLALGTNKLQATAGSGSAAWHYRRAKIVKLADCRWGILATLIGAIAGTLLVQHLDASFLKRLLPILLLAIAAYMFLKPKIGENDVHPRLSPRVFYPLAGLALGFYDGLIGPGVGSFWTMAFMLGLGFNLTKATAYTKTMNLASNVSSLALFFLAGQIYFAAGIAMAIGQLLGAQAGSHLVVTRGTKFIRPIFLTMVLAVTLKLIYDNYLK